MLVDAWGDGEFLSGEANSSVEAQQAPSHGLT